MASSAAYAVAIANAIKASGTIVSVSPEDFDRILSKSEKPLVITARGGFIRTNFQYLTSYKGFAFYTKTATPVTFSPKVEVVEAGKIWIPG